MTNAQAAADLEAQAALLGVHSRACRDGVAERYGDGEWADGCAACAREARLYHEAEAAAERSAFMWHYETNDEHREEMEREDAMFGGF